VQMQDPEFAKQVTDLKGAIYLVQLLLPATPTNIPVNAPAWARHLAGAKQAPPGYKGSVVMGREYNPVTEATSGFQHIGVLNLPSTLNSGLGGIAAGLTGALGGVTDSLDAQLNNAASLYDNNP